MSVTPMSSAAAPAAPGTIMEQVIALGDLSRLSPEQRARYYTEVCRSVGLNPLTKPFDYIALNGKLTLYPTRGAADQLRAIHGITCEIVSREQVGDLYVVHVRVTAPDGRRDEDLGIVSTASLRGEALANAILKAITKAKRRATLSLLGLNMLDETEVETIPTARLAQVDVETGEILSEPSQPAAAPSLPVTGQQASNGNAAMRAAHAAAKGKLTHGELSALARHIWGAPSMRALTTEQLTALRAAIAECSERIDAELLLQLAAMVDEATTQEALERAGEAIAREKEELGGARLQLLREAYARVHASLATHAEPAARQELPDASRAELATQPASPAGGPSWTEPAGDGQDEGASWTALWRAFEPLGIRSLADAARALGVPERALRGLTPDQVRQRLSEHDWGQR